MSLTEIKREIDKDFPVVFRKAGYLAHDLRRAARPRGSDYVTHTYEYLSKYKNHWFIRITITKKRSILGFLAWFYEGNKIVAVTLFANNSNLGFITPHFFQRYSERLCLGLKGRELILRFMDDMGLFNIRKIEQFAPGLHKMFFGMSTGYVLGTIDENQHFFKLNTFITHTMLHPSQIPMADEIRAFIDRYMDNATVTW